MKRPIQQVLKRIFMSGAVIAISGHALAEVSKQTFYRYTTNEGHKVVSQTIPPQYIRNGYELLTISGEIIKVVQPAPPEAEAERIANDRKMAKEQARTDLDLRRTYSSVQDIESAKIRNLQELQNTISILQANLASVRSQLKAQELHAASVERSGKTVSNEILKNITTLRTEEKELGVQIKQREGEYQKSADRYDQDRLRFIEISKLKQ